MTLKTDSTERKSCAGFTLLELMVAMSALAMLSVGILLTMQGVQTAWNRSKTTVQEHQAGRNALLTLSQRLREATLHARIHPQPLSATLNGEEPPTTLSIPWHSDLHFVCGPGRDLLPDRRMTSGQAIFFQAPFGYDAGQVERNQSKIATTYRSLSSTLNAWGYFVEFGRAPKTRPDFIASERKGTPPEPQRFRLLELRVPTHELDLFRTSDDGVRSQLQMETAQSSLYEWFRRPLRNPLGNRGRARPQLAVVAENIAALIVAPYDPHWDTLTVNTGTDPQLPFRLAPDYLYDSRRFQWDPGNPLADLSRHRLPPTLLVAVIALAENQWENFTPSEAVGKAERISSLMQRHFREARRVFEDLTKVENALLDMGVQHRIFTEVIPLRTQSPSRFASNPPTVPLSP